MRTPAGGALVLVLLLTSCRSAPSTNTEVDHGSDVTEPGARALDAEQASRDRSPSTKPQLRYYLESDSCRACAGVVTVVRELELEYGDRVDFEIVAAERSQARISELEALGFTEEGFGLVALSASGDPLTRVAGHALSRKDIVAALEIVLEARKPKDLRARAFDS